MMHTKQHINTYLFGLALLVELLSSTGLLAQNVYRDRVEDWGDVSVNRDEESFDNPVDGELYVVEYIQGPSNDSSFYDVMVPDSISSSYLKVLVRGADGGGYESHGGGEGATVWATFKMGTGTGEIQAGGTLRFIIGEKVFIKDDSDGQGGGGTGLAYKDPETGQWSILAVAGGGGGAGHSRDGVPGQITEDGTPGRGYGGNGGSDGEAGRNNTGKYSSAGEPGKGYKESMQDGEPVGSEGSATWGFGGGGKPNKDNSNCGGGGGGGYSGGGGGRQFTFNFDLIGGGGGGGGGSYVNTDFAVKSIKIANGSDGGEYSGFVEYKFSDDPDLVSREIQVKAASDKCLDLYKGLTDNGNNIQLYQCTGRSPQQWFYDGLYIRLGKQTDKCVGLNQSNSEVLLYDCQDELNRQWVYDGLTGTFRSAVYPKEACLWLLNGSTANDTDVQVIPCTGDNITLTQQWRIDGATLVDSKSGVKTIHLASKTDMCLDLYKGITDNTTSNVQLYQCTGRSPQQWVFDGLRIKYNQDQDKCVNLNGGDTSNGTNIKVRDCYDPDDKARQQWLYDGLTKSFRSAVDPSKCLQVEHEEEEEDNTSDNDSYMDETFGNDSNVELSDCDGSDAQRWVIEG